MAQIRHLPNPLQSDTASLAPVIKVDGNLYCSLAVCTSGLYCNLDKGTSKLSSLLRCLWQRFIGARIFQTGLMQTESCYQTLLHTCSCSLLILTANNCSCIISGYDQLVLMVSLCFIQQGKNNVNSLPLFEYMYNYVKW